MSNKISLTTLWKEFNPEADRSLRDDCQSEKYANSNTIAEYLDNGKVLLVSPGCERDIFTNEKIATACIKTDGEYTWIGSLSYYVKEYNLRLPKEFERKAIGAAEEKRSKTVLG